MENSGWEGRRGGIRVALLLVGAIAATVLAAKGLQGRDFAIAPAVALHTAVVCWLLLVGWGIGRFTRSPETRAGLMLLCATLALCWVGAELLLRFGLQRHTSYMERNGAVYGSPYEKPPPDWYRDYAPGAPLHADRPEFAYTRPVNSLGIPDEELPLQKAPDEIRIVALGDSFTEGVGAAHAESWVKVAERRLALEVPGRSIRTLNAGVAGSDVVYQFSLLRDRILPLAPDVVVAALNNTDVFDLLMRGGFERFRDDGTTRFSRRPPAWEPLYAMSYAVRALVHDVLGYDNALLRSAARSRGEEEARRGIHDALAALQELGRDHGFHFLVVIHPESYTEHLAGRYHASFAPLVEALIADPGIEVVDLLARYHEHGIMVEEISRFFWAIDAHYRPEGYAEMGEAIAREILASGWLD